MRSYSLTIRQLSIATILILNLSRAFGQGNTEKTFLQTNSKAHLYYIELNNANGIVYQMGGYLDKAGSGYSIRKTDTLLRQTGGGYVGKTTRLVDENNNTWLITQNKKTQKHVPDAVTNLAEVYTNLNNAYYLDSYFAMADELNKAYPLNHFSFRGGFYSWKELPNKSLDPLQFRNYAMVRLQQIKDSVSLVQNQYVSLANKLLQNIKTIDYTILKDSLITLPADFGANSRYFGTVVNEVSKQRPEFFFRLAEDLPQQRAVIFAAAENNRQVVANLKAVDGHVVIKKEFFKDRRFGKTMPYKAVGIYVLVAGLITLLIATQ